MPAKKKAPKAKPAKAVEFNGVDRMTMQYALLFFEQALREAVDHGDKCCLGERVKQIMAFAEKHGDKIHDRYGIAGLHALMHGETRARGVREAKAADEEYKKVAGPQSFLEKIKASLPPGAKILHVDDLPDYEGPPNVTKEPTRH